jgi:hypothetical protein
MYLKAIGVLLALLAWGAECDAWQLRFDPPANYLKDPQGGPRVHRLDRYAPLHERLTLISLGCLEGKDCRQALAGRSISVDDVLRGVRWNDFPAVFFDRSPTGKCLGLRRAQRRADYRCFAATAFYSGGLFAHIKADKYSNESIFVRGHFGDLQAWHAMATSKERPQQTRDAMLAWAKLWWGIIRGEVDLRADITAAADPIVARKFHRGARQVYNFVDYRVDARVRSIALGAILHMLQDSFAPCHTERDASGGIVRFNTAVGQSSTEHHAMDGNLEHLQRIVAMPNGPAVVGQRLVELAAQSAPWDAARYELLKAWSLAPDPRDPHPGLLCPQM